MKEAGTGRFDDPIILDSDDAEPVTLSSIERLKTERCNSLPIRDDRLIPLRPFVIPLPNSSRNPVLQRNGDSDSEEEDDSEEESDMSEGNEAGPDVGSLRHNAPLTLDEDDDYSALLVAGEVSQKALSRLQREGKLPPRDMLGLSLSESAPSSLANARSKAGTGSGSKSGSGISIHALDHARIQNAHTPSGKRPSGRVCGNSDEDTPIKRIRMGRSHVEHRPPSTSTSFNQESDSSFPVQRRSTRALRSRPSDHKTILSEPSNEGTGSERPNALVSAHLGQVRECLASERGLVIKLPKPNFARARRLLVPSDSSLPVTCVYMRADVQFFSRRHW